MLVVGPARAHSTLISMTPADGSLLTTAPTSVVLTFDSPIQDIGVVVVVTAPDGSHVQSGAPTILDNVVTQGLSPITVKGRYLVAYRVTSTDGHPVTRELSFDYLERGTAAPATVPEAAGSGGYARWWLPALLAVALAVGAAVLRGRHRRRRPVDGAP
jgi:methionine-rich copper-binding protein CopC